MKTPLSELQEYTRNLGQMGQLASLEAILDQADDVEGVARVKRAQEAATIRQLTGIEPKTGEDMKTIIFGDVNHAPPSPVPAPNPIAKGLGTLAKLGIGAALLASGIGAGAVIPYILDSLRAKPVPPVVTPGTNTTTERDYTIGDIEVIEQP